MRLLLFISCFGFALEFTQVLKDHEKDRNEQNRQGGGSCHAAKNRGATACWLADPAPEANTSSKTPKMKEKT
jgi:hypothetical protein